MEKIKKGRCKRTMRWWGYIGIMYDKKRTHSKRVHARIEVIWTCRTMGVMVALWKDQTRENLDFGNSMEIKCKVKTKIETKKIWIETFKEIF